MGEVCFNTAMTGYQEVMTDPSYDSQIVTFTFPHIGNVGANEEDHESRGLGAVGCVVRQEVTPHSNFRAQNEFVEWMKDHGKIGLSGIDTRALTRRIRMSGAPNAVIAHSPRGEFDLKALKAQAAEWSGLEGLDLVPGVTRAANEDWTGGHWQLGFGYGEGRPPSRMSWRSTTARRTTSSATWCRIGRRSPSCPRAYHARRSARAAARWRVPVERPGDLAATGEYAVPVIKGLLERDVPLFGICLGHQMLGLAAGARPPRCSVATAAPTTRPAGRGRGGARARSRSPA